MGWVIEQLGFSSRRIIRLAQEYHHGITAERVKEIMLNRIKKE